MSYDLTDEKSTSFQVTVPSSNKPSPEPLLTQIYVAICGAPEVPVNFKAIGKV